MTTVPFASALLLAAEGEGFNPLDPKMWPAFVWTVIIFIGALPFMWKVVFGPITTALHARDKRAEDAIERAEDAKAAAEQVKADIQTELQNAREEAARQIRNARDMAEKQKAELLAQAEREAGEQRAKAMAEIESEKRRALAEIRDTVVDLSLGAAQQLLHREFAGSDQRELVKTFLKDVE